MERKRDVTFPWGIFPLYAPWFLKDSREFFIICEVTVVLWGSNLSVTCSLIYQFLQHSKNFLPFLKSEILRNIEIYWNIEILSPTALHVPGCLVLTEAGCYCVTTHLWCGADLLDLLQALREINLLVKRRDNSKWNIPPHYILGL